LKSEEKQRLYAGSSLFCISADNSDEFAGEDHVHSCFYMWWNRDAYVVEEVISISEGVSRLPAKGRERLAVRGSLVRREGQRVIFGCGEWAV